MSLASAVVSTGATIRSTCAPSGLGAGGSKRSSSAGEQDARIKAAKAEKRNKDMGSSLLAMKHEA
jgi:hypothetical protein